MKRMISTLKRPGLVALLALAGGLFLTSPPVSAVKDPTTVYIGINNVSYTCLISNPASCSGEGWVYDTVNKVLKLNNFNGYEIYANGDLIINLKGNNTITGQIGSHKSLISVVPFNTAGLGKIWITTAPGENGKLTLNKTHRSLDVLLAPDEIRIAGRAEVTINHTYPGGGNCSHDSTAVIKSLYDQIIVFGHASLTANAQSCYTGEGLPESIFRAKTFINFNTTSNVTANMTSTDGVVDKSRMIVLSSFDTSFSTKQLYFTNTGVYKFNASQQVLAASGYGVIGGLTQNGQVIQTPAGATFDNSGILVDASNNDIRATTNNLIVSKTPVATYNLTINCGVGGTCIPNHANPYNDGETATITLTPNAGKRVKTVTGATKVNDTTYTVLMDGDKTVSVEFEDIPALPATITVDKTTFKQNENLTITINNLDAGYEGKIVEFWLNSDPIKLGEATVLHGSATVTALVPCSVKPGDHTITAKIDGIAIGTPVSVKVLSAPVCATPRTPNTGVGSSYSMIALIAGIMATVSLSGLVLLKLAKTKTN